MTVSELAELSKLSKSYVSQVKNGKRPPSQRLLACLSNIKLNNHRRNGHLHSYEAIEAFLKSRREGSSLGTIEFYGKYLSKAIPVLGLTPSASAISKYLDSLSCSTGGKHAYFRAISVFYNWLYSTRSGFSFGSRVNPITLVDPPKRPKRILPSLTREQVEALIANANNVRDKAIIYLFTESGLRLSELLGIKITDIDWEAHTVRVTGKGDKEGHAPFGTLSERYLKLWLAEFRPEKHQVIWNIGYWGIKTMLNNLRERTGIQCQPHTFRRTFACLLRKAGVDTMTIKDLGRWESLEMVQRYTRSVTFEDSLRHYKAPLS
jgi:site-specific recombinase XerD